MLVPRYATAWMNACASQRCGRRLPSSTPATVGRGIPASSSATMSSFSNAVARSSSLISPRNRSTRRGSRSSTDAFAITWVPKSRMRDRLRNTNRRARQSGSIWRFELPIRRR